jgi:cell division protein FtsN
MEPGSAGATLARVRVGPFSERAEAASNLRDLQALGYKPFIAEERD